MTIEMAPLTSPIDDGGDTSSVPVGEATAGGRVWAGAISDSWLLGWALVRSGYPCTVAIGHDPAVVADGVKGGDRGAMYGVHLTRRLPITTLLRAMRELKGRNGAGAVLFMVEDAGSESYREHLHVDKNQQVLGIRRKFWKHGTHKQRPRVAGVAWRTGGGFRGVTEPSPGVKGAGCWRTIRALLQCQAAGAGVIRQVILPAPVVQDFRSDLVAQLPPASLRSLARDMGYGAVREFCFAHRDAVIEDGALLRGPLFIDGDAVITAEQIHFGPGWVSRHSAAMTMPASGDDGEASGVRANGAHYFVGPQTHQRPVYEFFKRTFDVVFALLALTVTLPICLAVALIIKLYDRGPVFFVHNREGRGGRIFGCMKFRTMVRDAEALKAKLRKSSQVDGPQFKMADDPRITPVGRFLRKSNIDELPQFLNVLRGDMSIVGPRPSPFEENQLCPGWREARLSIKPGITGLWQISRSRDRGAADFQEWIFFDTQYVDRRGFWLDMRIVLLTIKELFGKGQ